MLIKQRLNCFSPNRLRVCLDEVIEKFLKI